MSEFTFGQRVKVSAETKPVYGIASEVYEPAGWQSSGIVFRPSTGKYRVQNYEVRGQPEPPGDDDTWPGLAVPDPEGVHEQRFYSPGLEPVEVPQGGRHRRLRRLPLTEVGVVVGHTWRQEGTYDGGSGIHYGEPDLPYLIEIRRLPVLQVALDTGSVARVVDVWHEDVVQA